MNRAVEASQGATPQSGSAGPLPPALFWLEKGYPSTLIFDAYGSEAERTQKREAVSAEGTQEVRAIDILEEILPSTRRASAQRQVQAPRDATQEVDALDVLEEAPVAAPDDVQAPPPPPPKSSRAPVPAIYAPVLAHLAAPPPPPPAPEALHASHPMVIVTTPEPAASSSSELHRAGALATAEWERRRRVGHWLVGGALLVASAVVLSAAAVHTFAGELGDASLRTPRTEDGRRNGRTALLLTAQPVVTAPAPVVAAQPPIPTVSIDALPPARRGRR